MKLVGIYLSPFVRRVAVAMRHYDMPYEHINANVVEKEERDVVAKYNGLVRMPSLVMDDGEVIIDSGQILSELDRQVGPERALVPRDPALQKDFGQMIAFLTGGLEKVVAAFYELTRRPEDKTWQAWADQCMEQAAGGLMAAEKRAPESLLTGGYLFEDRLTHADIAAVIAYEFMGHSVEAPRLAALAKRLGETSEFTETRP